MKSALFVVAFTAALISAETVYFTDDFNDGNADGWTELPTGAQYEVNQDNRYQFTAGAGVDQAVSYNSDEPSGMSVSDYSVLSEVCAHSPTHGVSLNVRCNSASDEGYALYIRIYQDQAAIYRLSSAGNVQLVQASIDLEYDQFYWARFTCVGDSLHGKIWQGELSAEPDSWLLTTTDSFYSNPGYFALLAANIGSQTGIDGEFDNVTVSEPVPLFFRASTWAMIKATL